MPRIHRLILLLCIHRTPDFDVLDRSVIAPHWDLGLRSLVSGAGMEPAIPVHAIMGEVADGAGRNAATHVEDPFV